MAKQGSNVSRYELLGLMLVIPVFILMPYLWQGFLYMWEASARWGGDRAAWVQAVCTLLAVCVAIAVPWKISITQEQTRRRIARDRARGIALDFLPEIRDQLSRCRSISRRCEIGAIDVTRFSARVFWTAEAAMAYVPEAESEGYRVPGGAPILVDKGRPLMAVYSDLIPNPGLVSRKDRVGELDSAAFAVAAVLSEIERPFQLYQRVWFAGLSVSRPSEDMVRANFKRAHSELTRLVKLLEAAEASLEELFKSP
jgi:hypothetical protein